MGFAVVIGLMQVIALLTAQDAIIAIFTNESQVKAEMIKAWYIFSLFAFFDTT